MYGDFSKLKIQYNDCIKIINFDNHLKLAHEQIGGPKRRLNGLIQK